MRILKSLILATMASGGLIGCVEHERVYERGPDVVYREHYGDRHEFYGRDCAPPPREYHGHWRH